MDQLTESEFEKITNRAGMQNQSMDYMRINGKPYVIGESAERHGLVTQHTGSARYTSDYYSIFAAAVLGRLYYPGREDSIFGSHPPSDVSARLSKHLIEPGVVVDNHDFLDLIVGRFQIFSTLEGAAILNQPAKNDKGQVFLVNLLDETNAIKSC